ncbi:MAG: hypothetical protein JNM27_16830 [Leptospirales bacterium]|nr:hypothetical protein [Leptospirales bacterium]
MQKIFETLKKSFQAAFKPSIFFGRETVTPVSASLLRTIIFVFVIASPVALSAVIRAVFYPYKPLSPQRSPVLNGLTGATTEYNFPYDLIVFVLGWILFILFASTIRLGFLRVLGEKSRSFAIALFVTSFATVPPIAIAGIQRTLANLFPLSLLADYQFLLHLRIVITFFILVAAWLWEGLICMRGFKAQVEQNRGRAVLTWLSPYVFSFALFWFVTGWIAN